MGGASISCLSPPDPMVPVLKARGARKFVSGPHRRLQRRSVQDSSIEDEHSAVGEPQPPDNQQATLPASAVIHNKVCSIATPSRLVPALPQPSPSTPTLPSTEPFSVGMMAVGSATSEHHWIPLNSDGVRHENPLTLANRDSALLLSVRSTGSMSGGTTPRRLRQKWPMTETGQQQQQPQHAVTPTRNPAHCCEDNEGCNLEGNGGAAKPPRSRRPSSCVSDNNKDESYFSGLECATDAGDSELRAAEMSYQRWVNSFAVQ